MSRTYRVLVRGELGNRFERHASLKSAANQKNGVGLQQLRNGRWEPIGQSGVVRTK